MLGALRRTDMLFGRRATRAPACSRSESRRRRQWSVECLEERTLLSTWPVTTLADSGAGSLRSAIDQANMTQGASSIDIQVAGTITLESALPDLTNTTGATEVIGPGAGR